MKTKNIVLSSALAAALACAGMAVAQAPSENIDPHRFGNLAAAQHHIVEAYQSIAEAERENKDQLGGHAEKAQQLLADADRELKAAAEVAEHRK
ncbi:MAG: hypothetical protein WA867_19445 [Candidatus Acidiferrales bacterium]